MEFIFQSLKHLLESGSLVGGLGAIFLAYFGGILSSFTPCVYPLIPITIGLIGNRAERTVKDGWLLSSFYVFGMAAIYSVLGVLAALSGRIFGTLTNTWGWYLFIGQIMILASLWMLGAITFDPVAYLNHKLGRNKLNSSKLNEAPKTSLASAFIMGATSGFIASPCTTPVLTTILSYIATQKSIVMGALLMMSFALGLGTILVVIGTFTSALKILPRSGKWLNTVKLVSGLIVLLLGQYFIFKAGTIK